MDITVTVQNIQEEVTTESIVLAPGVEACRITVVRQGSDTKTTTVGECVRANESSEPNFGQFSVVVPELLGKLRLDGWFRADADYEMISRTPFTHVTSGNPFELVRIKSYDHTLYTVDGLPLPVAMRFNYIDGRVSNAAFDLLALAKHLEAREDVTLCSGQRHGVHAPKKHPFIQPIPYYNCDKGNTEFLEFTWHPEVALFREFRTMLANGPFDSFDRYTVAHTLMGNDAFRIPERDHDSVDED